VVLDVARFRGGPEDVQAGIINTAALDGRGVRIRLPQDPGQAGVAQVLDLTKRLAGYTVASERPTGPKETRAAPFASQVNVGNVAMVRASWNAAFVDELRGFPSARHDDQVDAASDAFAELIAPPRPTKVTPLRF
jgi:predicted phage terminase large subunit-like protein